MTAVQSGSQNLYFHERLCRRQEFPKSSCCISSIAKTYIYHFIIGKKGKQTGDEPQAHQTSDRKPGGLPFRLKKLRTFACFPTKKQVRGKRLEGKTDRTERSSWSVRALGSQVGMSPIGSYVGGLTSKGQVGVLLWEHRGWMLHMALSYKAKNIGYNSMLSSVPTYSILLSTIFDGFETTACLE